jgi:hypothetical protein
VPDVDTAPAETLTTLAQVAVSTDARTICPGSITTDDTIAEAREIGRMSWAARSVIKPWRTVSHAPNAPKMPSSHDRESVGAESISTSMLLVAGEAGARMRANARISRRSTSSRSTNP